MVRFLTFASDLKKKCPGVRVAGKLPVALTSAGIGAGVEGGVHFMQHLWDSHHMDV